MLLAYLSDTSGHRNFVTSESTTAIYSKQLVNMWELDSSYLRNNPIVTAIDVNMSQPDSD